jgi:glycine cleavage system H protein
MIDRITRKEFLKGAAIGTVWVISSVIPASCNRDDSNSSPITSPLLSSTEGLLCSSDHIWVRAESENRARIGITRHLWNLVTNKETTMETVALENAQVGSSVTYDVKFGVLESYKMAVDLISPVSGVVIEANDNLSYHNTADVYGDGWVLLVEMSQPQELTLLMSYEDYMSILPAETEQGTE